MWSRGNTEDIMQFLERKQISTIFIDNIQNMIIEYQFTENEIVLREQHFT